MTSPEFVEAVATAIKDSPDLELSHDVDYPVNLAWGISTEPDNIIVQLHGGAVYRVSIQWLDGPE